MPYDALDVKVESVLPGSAEGRLVLTAYFRDIVSRCHGREATQPEVDDAMSAEPSGGLRLVATGIGELTRVFVRPEARRRGTGQRLLEAVEGAAREQGMTRLRLDTG